MSDPLPEPPSNQNVRDAEWFDKGWKAAMRRIAEGEQEARTLARTEVIAQLREAIGELSKFEVPTGEYVDIEDVYDTLAALSRLGERE
jgi:hypothetical protein